MFSEGVIGGSNIEALEVWSLSECWPAQGNADVLKIRQKNLPDNFPVCWLLLHLSRFLTGISRKDMWYYVAYVYNGELISLIGNQRVGIFPPKSEIVFVLSLALIWCRNFQDRTIPVGGDTWTSFWRKEGIIRIIRITRKKPYASVWEAVRNEHGSKVAGQSRDRPPTVKQRFLDVSNNLELFWRKSLNGHATVVGGHATVGRLSNNVFGCFKQLEMFLKKVTERSRDSGRRSRDCRPTVKQRFLDVSSDLGEFWKNSLNGHATVVGGHATIGRLSNNVSLTFQAIGNNFEKSRWTVIRQWSKVTRPSADCQTTFFRRFKQFGKILKKSPWTVTREWSEVTRPSADCQTAFF